MACAWHVHGSARQQTAAKRSRGCRPSTCRGHGSDSSWRARVHGGGGDGTRRDAPLHQLHAVALVGHRQLGGLPCRGTGKDGASFLALKGSCATRKAGCLTGGAVACRLAGSQAVPCQLTHLCHCYAAHGVLYHLHRLVRAGREFSDVSLATLPGRACFCLCTSCTTPTPARQHPSSRHVRSHVDLPAGCPWQGPAGP